MRQYLPVWAIQLSVGLAVVAISVTLLAAVIGAVVGAPSGFLDEVGRTVARVAPQPQADLRSEDELKEVIRAMPDGRLRVASVVQETDRVVFTVTADRDAVRAAVQSGDELRLDEQGQVEIAPTGLPGVIDRLGEAMRELRKRFFGDR